MAKQITAALALLALTLTAAAPASAQPARYQRAHAQQAGGLAWLTGEIRGQMAAVEAQARASFIDCHDADDVYDELKDLCRLLDRFEQELHSQHVSRARLRRLARYAERIDRQATEVQKEVHDAIDDLRRREMRHLASPIATTIGPALSTRQAALQYVANRSVSRSSTLRTRGLTISFGPGGTRVSLGGGPAPSPWVGRTARFPGRDVSPFLAAYNATGPAPWARQSEAAALCAQADRLHDLAHRLAEIVGD